MTTAVFILVVLLFLLIGTVSIVAIVFGFPGAWMILLTALVIELSDGLWRDPESTGGSFTLWLFISCVLLALAGEIAEFLSGMYGAKRGGSTRRGMWGALVGGIVGAILGTFIVPIPLVGSLIGSVVGTFCGAMIMELADPELRTAAALRPAIGATIGRLLGTIIKIPVAITIFVVLFVNLVWP